ncbi:carboxymuconolactone decarboxylase family protein [Nocardia sp. NPDC004415]
MADEQNTGWTGGQRAFGDFAPGLAATTPTTLAFHHDFARRNGVTEAELKEAITHLAFYAGWPNGMGAMTAAKRVFGAND